MSTISPILFASSSIISLIRLILFEYAKDFHIQISLRKFPLLIVKV